MEDILVVSWGLLEKGIRWGGHKKYHERFARTVLLGLTENVSLRNKIPSMSKDGCPWDRQLIRVPVQAEHFVFPV